MWIGMLTKLKSSHNEEDDWVVKLMLYTSKSVEDVKNVLLNKKLL